MQQACNIKGERSTFTRKLIHTKVKGQRPFTPQFFPRPSEKTDVTEHSYTLPFTHLSSSHPHSLSPHTTSLSFSHHLKATPTLTHPTHSWYRCAHHLLLVACVNTLKLGGGVLFGPVNGQQSDPDGHEASSIGLTLCQLYESIQMNHLGLHRLEQLLQEQGPTPCHSDFIE